MPNTVQDTMESTLAARYGRTAGRRRRDWWLGAGVAALIVLVFTVWVVWAGLDNGKGSIETRDLGYRVVNDSTVSVSWELTVSAGVEVSCAMQAQNVSHAIVGWKIVELPASDDYTRQFTETLRTVQRPVTGLIYRCWLT